MQDAAGGAEWRNQAHRIILAARCEQDAAAEQEAYTAFGPAGFGDWMAYPLPPYLTVKI
jgi:hypothetical protein